MYIGSTPQTTIPEPGHSPLHWPVPPGRLGPPRAPRAQPALGARRWHGRSAGGLTRRSETHGLVDQKRQFYTETTGSKDPAKMSLGSSDSELTKVNVSRLKFQGFQRFPCCLELISSTFLGFQKIKSMAPLQPLVYISKSKTTSSSRSGPLIGTSSGLRRKRT